MLLTAMTITLRSPTDALLAHHLGRANYAETLRRLALIDRGLATTIHDGNGPKPLTCSSILDARVCKAGLQVRAGQCVRVRLTGITAPVSHGLLDGFVGRRPNLWTVDRHSFDVVGVTCDAAKDPSSGYTTYEQLVDTRLRQGHRLSKTLPLCFAGPTAFKSQGVHVPLPLPELVFGSLVERWNHFSPETLKATFREFARTQIVISFFDVHSRPVRHKNGSVRMGAVGEVTYRVLNQDYLVTAHILADYAKHAGVGVQTTNGMGQCWRLPGTAAERRSRH